MLLSIPDAVDALHRGQVVAVPTLTFYGLAADVRNPEAVAAVFDLKRRPSGQPSPVLVRSRAAAADLLVAELARPARALMGAFWPGRLTIILEGADPALPTFVRSGETVAVRQDGHPLLARLLDQARMDVTGTSANLSGQPSCTLGEEVSAVMAGHPAYAGHIGEGPTPGELASTLVRLTGGRGVEVLRRGPVEEEAILAALAAAEGP